MKTYPGPACLRGGPTAGSGLRCSFAAVALLSGLLVAACGSAGDVTLAETAGADNAGGVGPAAADPLAACAASRVSDSPRSILEAVAQVNALPKPLTLPCFLATLPRPLALQASRSIFSAQPAVGKRSPRMFIFSDPLLMTIVPAGSGSHLLEFGERRSETTSIKAEIEFPVVRPLRDEDPFERLVYMDGFTLCAGCHAGEQPAEDIAFTRAFVSQSLRPVSRERVGLDELLEETRACDVDAEPERCAMLQAVFAEGDVVEREFSESIATFY